MPIFTVVAVLMNSAAWESKSWFIALLHSPLERTGRDPVATGTFWERWLLLTIFEHHLGLGRRIALGENGRFGKWGKTVSWD